MHSEGFGIDTWLWVDSIRHESFTRFDASDMMGVEMDSAFAFLTSYLEHLSIFNK